MGPPTWRSAFNRGLIAAGIFFALMFLAFRRSIVQSLALSLFMLAFYVPMGYYIDLFVHRRRERKAQREREQQAR